MRGLVKIWPRTRGNTDASGGSDAKTVAEIGRALTVGLIWVRNASLVKETTCILTSRENWSSRRKIELTERKTTRRISARNVNHATGEPENLEKLKDLSLQRDLKIRRIIAYENLLTRLWSVLKLLSMFPNSTESWVNNFNIFCWT